MFALPTPPSPLKPQPQPQPEAAAAWPQLEAGERGQVASSNVARPFAVDDVA